MEFSGVIAARHSVRQFQDKAVDREIVDAILDQAQTAPSSKNSRSSTFVVVDDKDMLEVLFEMRTYGSALLRKGGGLRRCRAGVRSLTGEDTHEQK